MERPEKNVIMKNNSHGINEIKSAKEVDFLIANRKNLKNFHYCTNDESIYDHFCEKVAEVFGLKENPKGASNISKQELSLLNNKYNLTLKSAYLNGPTCNCGRTLNGYDFILNAIFRHGAKFLRDPKTEAKAKFIMPFRRAMDFLVCTDCGELLRLSAGTWYSDSSSIDSYGPCCSNE